MQLSIPCTVSYAACRSRLARRRKPSLSGRLTTLALAVAVLVLMAYGERWVLAQTSAAGNELVVATCVLDAVYADDVGPATVCTSTSANNDNGN